MLMAVLKYKDIAVMNAEEREERLREMRIELVKKTAPSGKGGKIKNKEIKKAIARILTAETIKKNPGGSQ